MNSAEALCKIAALVVALTFVPTAIAQGAREEILASLRQACLTRLDEVLMQDFENAANEPIDRAKFCACADERFQKDTGLETIANKPEVERLANPKYAQYLRLSYLHEGLNCYFPNAGKQAAAMGRKATELRTILQRHAQAVYGAYSRALKRNSELKGKAVFELTVEPSGKVSKTRVLSSDLADEQLEVEVANLLLGIDFGPKNVAQQIVTYPVTFLPN